MILEDHFYFRKSNYHHPFILEYSGCPQYAPVSLWFNSVLLTEVLPGVDVTIKEIKGSGAPGDKLVRICHIYAKA